jgi:taurine dioxygenase
MTFSITPLSAALGAEVRGLDLTRPLTEAKTVVLRQALLQHLLLVFPEQHLTAGQLVDFCRCFGPITRHILDQFYHPEDHDLCIISNVLESGKGRATVGSAGSYWHSDLSYLAEPAETSMLYAIEVPETGGDTLFCNMYTAYEELPEAMRSRIAGLTAVHNIMSGTGADSKVPLTEAQRAKVPDAIHAIVQRHPETGREALFVNPGFTRRVVELDARAGTTLLEELFAHANEARFTYRHKWQAGDVTLFDGRASMHSATGGYTNTDRRTLWRAFMGGSYAV